MQALTAIVLGATGLIGKQLVERLFDDPAFATVKLLVRRPVKITHKKLTVEIVNFNDLADFTEKLGTSDCVFCCVGTTQKQVNGDKNEYRKVDFDIPVNAAKIGKRGGFKKYVLVSSVGANANSKNFYLKLKGEVENEIAAEKFEAFHVFRPSMLLGQRNEVRAGELIGKAVMKSFSFLLVGSFEKYKAIEAVDVAKAMVAASKLPAKGMVVYHHNDMQALIKQNEVGF